jgi:WD40 repeat protein
MVIDIYEVPSGMKLVATCKGHSSFISHLDWSSDSSFLQTVSGDYELLYWNALNGKQITNTTTMKEIKWATQCCILGYNVNGIWEKGMDGTDVNWVDRNLDATCLVSGDDMLNVRLHSYPAIKENVSCLKLIM